MAKPPPGSDASLGVSWKKIAVLLTLIVSVSGITPPGPDHWNTRASTSETLAVVPFLFGCRIDHATTKVWKSSQTTAGLLRVLFDGSGEMAKAVKVGSEKPSEM